MLDRKSVSIALFCHCLSFCLLFHKSKGFQSYVARSRSSHKSFARWRLHEKKLDVNHKNMDENKIIVKMDDLIPTTKQQQHNQIHHDIDHDHSAHMNNLSHSSSFSINNSHSFNVLSSSKSHFIPKDEINTILTFGSDEKEKIVNAFGLWCFAMTLLSCPPWAAVMSVVDGVCKLQPSLDPHMSFYDYTGKIWSRLYLRLINSYPAISGDVEWIHNQNKGNACLYVANHASWIDIPIVCTVLDPVFKFIAKADLKSVPCIGQQLVGGHHILIDRDDRRSQLRAFKEGVNWLKNGVPVMAFPEGKRSPDGRLADFKGGIFSMAVKANVPIVPISISNAHAVMPKYSLLPVQSGANKLSVHVHPAIHTDNLTEKELSDRVFNAIASKLPHDQRPLSQVEKVAKEGAKIAINA